MAGDEIVHDLRRAAVGHVRDRRAGAACEQGGGQVRRGADALRAVVDLVGIGLGVGDQLADRARRKIRAHHQDDRDLRHDDDRLECGRIEPQVLVEQHMRGERSRLRREQRVAIGLGGGDIRRAQRAAGARVVLDDDRMAPARRQPVARMRATTSGPPPGGAETRIRTVRFG